MAVKSTVGDSLGRMLLTARGTRAKDEQIAANNLLTGKKLLQADVDLARSKVGLVKDQADAQSALIDAAYAQPKAEADLLSTEAGTAKTKAETTKLGVETQQQRFDLKKSETEFFDERRSTAAEQNFGMLLNLSPDSIQFDDRGVLQLDTNRLLSEAPGVAVDLFNTSNVKWMKSVDERGNLVQNNLEGFRVTRDPNTNEAIYIPLLRNTKGGEPAPATVNGTADPNDPVIRLSQSELDAQLRQAFVSSWEYGGKNSKAAVAEIGRRGGNVWLDSKERAPLVQTGDAIKDAVTEDIPLPEQQRRQLIQITDRAVVDGDMATLNAIVQDLGVAGSRFSELGKTNVSGLLSQTAARSGQSQQLADELIRQRTEAENQYLDDRIDNKNPRFADPLSFDLSNAITDTGGTNPRAIRPADLEEQMTALREKNRGILRERMAEAKQEFPAFERDYAKAAALLASGVKLVTPEEEAQIKEGFGKYTQGGPLTPEIFQKVIKEEPNLALQGVHFFAQGSENPLPIMQEFRNLALRGASDYKAETEADDRRQEDELNFTKYKEAVRQAERFADNIEEVNEALRGNADKLYSLLADPTFDMMDRADLQQSEFLPAARALLTRSNAQGRLLSNEAKEVVNDIKARMFFEVMQNQGSLGLKGWMLDSFYRSNAPIQLSNLMDKLVVSPDGSKIAVYDGTGGDVVFKGEISFGQISDMFDGATARELIKSLPVKNF